MFTRLALTALLVTSPLIADNEASSATGTLSFTPPTGWMLADRTNLPENILAMVVGTGKTPFPPSINLGVHHNAGSLRSFLKYVKEVNRADGIAWTDLGTIRTEAGDASLSQLDTRTEWGMLREMQVILVADNTAYILTAAALRDEFSAHYPEFFAAMRSLKINKVKD